MNGQAPFLLYKKRVSRFLEQPQNKTFTMLGLTFVALIIFGAFAIRPTISTIITLNKRIKEGKELELKMQEKIDNLNTLQEQVFRNERKVSLAKSALPPKERIDGIIANLELVAEKYNLQLLSLSPGESPEEENLLLLPAGVNALTMTMRLEGTNSDFQNFLEHLENLPRQINVKSTGYIIEDETITQNAEIIYFYSGL